MEKQITYSQKNILKNSTLSLICRFLSMLLSFLSAPLMLHCLGTEKYGIWATLLSMISWIYYFDLGIGNGLRNKLAECFALDNNLDAKKYIRISYFLLLVISSTFFVLVSILVISVDIESLINVHIDDEDISKILIFSVFLACVNFIASLVNNILYAGQQAGLVSIFNLLGQAFFVSFLFLYTLYGNGWLLVVAIAEGIAQLLKNLIETFYTFKQYHEISPFNIDLDFSYIRGLLTFGIQVFLMQICALVLNSTDNIIIMKFLGAEEVTPYSLCYKFFMIGNGIFVALITPLLSAYTMAYAKKDYIWIKKVFKKGFFLYIALCLCAIVGCFIFEPFMHIWLQKDLYYQPGLIILTCIYFIMLMFTHNFSTFLNGIGKLGESSIAMIIQTLLNVPVSIYFAVNLNMGVNGVILGSIASMSIGVLTSCYVGIRELKRMKVLS